MRTPSTDRRSHTAIAHQTYLLNGIHLPLAPCIFPGILFLPNWFGTRDAIGGMDLYSIALSAMLFFLLKVTGGAEQNKEDEEFKRRKILCFDGEQWGGSWNELYWSYTHPKYTKQIKSAPDSHGTSLLAQIKCLNPYGVCSTGYFLKTGFPSCDSQCKPSLFPNLWHRRRIPDTRNPKDWTSSLIFITKKGFFPWENGGW